MAANKQTKEQAKAQEKVQEMVEQTKNEVQEALEETKTANEEEDKKGVEGLTFLEMYEKAQRGAKFRRKSWKKDVNGCVFIRRGESKLVLGDEKWASYYQPSQEDAIAKDWIEI